MKTRISKALPYPVIGQWHIIFALTPAWWTQRASIFQMGLFKLTSLPPEGEMIQKKHYQGFWLKWEIEMPTFGWAHNFKRDDE